MNIQKHNYSFFRVQILVALIWGISFLAQAVEPFQIKGRQLGQRVAEACDGFPAESGLDDTINTLKKSIKGLTPMNTTSCLVDAKSFAGVGVPNGIQLMFVSDKLVQVKFTLEAVDVGRSWKILSTLISIYGTPKTDHTLKKTMGWSIHKWVQGQQKLEVNRQSSGSEEVLVR